MTVKLVSDTPQGGTISAMGSLSNWFDRAVMAFVTRVPGLLVGIVALALYPGVALILPLALRWNTWGLIEANVLGAIFAAAVTLGWFVAQVEAARRRHLVEWTTDLRLLSAEEFEWLVGEVFRREGWKVEETGRQSEPDGNVDLRLTRQGKRVIVQCKRWQSWDVKVDEIQRLAGTLVRERLPASAGIFVTLSDFTPQARKEAHETGLALINGRDLYARVEKVRRPELCPTCQAPMRLDRSLRGWWFRCVAPGCSGKRDLSTEPGRAVGFLTESTASH
jgi:HJR/Mrr/RecB family endonuclease